MKSHEVLTLLKISRVTLTKYVKSGKLTVIKLPSGRYEYDEESVYSLLGKDYQRKHVIYARVSSSQQKSDLENQILQIQQYCNSKGISIDQIYSDVKTGLHLDRKGFNQLLDDVIDNKIDTVYISYKDRLARLSYDLVERLFLKYNVKIHVINKFESNSEKELFSDLMAIIHSFSMKMYSKRCAFLKRLCNEEKEQDSIS